MPKPERPRKTRTPEKPAARRGRSSPAPASSPEGVSLASAVFHDEITARAYVLFLARGGQHVDDWADWFHPEAEVLGKKDRPDCPSGAWLGQS